MIFIVIINTYEFGNIFTSSYTYDLSQPLQPQMRTIPGSLKPASKYVWNQQLLKGFTKNKISSKWVISIIHGFICQKSILW